MWPNPVTFDQIDQIWSHLLKKSLMENFIFCVVERIWWIRKRKVSIKESKLSKDSPLTLLKSLSVMCDFLGIFQEFNKNSFQQKKHH